jgi:hypothetical protein
MAHHTVNQVAQRHNVMRQRGFKTEKIEIRGTTFSYYIMCREMMPGFPDFTHCVLAFERNSNDPSSGSLFGISDAIPEDFREFAMQYEILHHWFNVAVKAAAEEEVRILMASSLPEERQNAYIRWRQDFFGRLAVHGNEHGETEQRCAEYEELETYFFTLGGIA